MDTSSLSIDGAGLSQPTAGPQAVESPAIVGALRRTQIISQQIADLCERARRIANRLEYGKEDLPQPPSETKTGAGASPAYSEGLCGQFLEIHDETDRFLAEAAQHLDRIAAIV